MDLKDELAWIYILKLKNHPIIPPKIQLHARGQYLTCRVSNYTG